MAGMVSFRITLATENAGLPAELAARAADLSPVLDDIIDSWAAGNEEKFSRGKGAQTSGVDQDSSLFWKPLTEKYGLEKAAAGYADHLMVRTGDLRRALTSPEGFFRAVGPQEAIFGTPMDEQDEEKILGNWASRQALFLGAKDRADIRRMVYDYLSQGGDYQALRNSEGLALQNAKREQAQLDVAYDDAVNAPETLL